MKTGKSFAMLLCCVALVCRCASKPRGGRGGVMSPDQITAPEPIAGNTGQYMNPYSSTGRYTAWMQTALDAAPADTAKVRKSGPHTPDEIPALDAQRQRDAAARAGGFERIREQSDQSFSSADDLCLYLYVKHSREADYGQVYDFVTALYPDMGRRCPEAMRKAAAGHDGGRSGDGPGGGDSGGPGGGGPGGGGPGGGGMGGGRGGWGGGFFN
jgi:hypothetical protein